MPGLRWRAGLWLGCPPAGFPTGARPSPGRARGFPAARSGWRTAGTPYLHLYGRLPDNYVTKREAQELGWTGGSVERYTGEGTAIGGSRFGNYEGLLPEKDPAW